MAHFTDLYQRAALMSGIKEVYQPKELTNFLQHPWQNGQMQTSGLRR